MNAESPSALAAHPLVQVGDLLDVGIISTDAELNIRGWNQWLQVATGRAAGEVVGQSLLSVFPELAGTKSEQAFRRALAGETVVLSHRFHRWLLPLPAGPAFAEFEQMQQSARILPITEANEVLGTVAIIQDVTERVAREAELRVAMERAEAASSAKSEFLAAMSHELRTPLGAIIGYADLVETEVVGPLVDRQKSHMQRIKAGAWHLLSIIEEILTFSRVEAGKETLSIERMDACAILAEAISLIEPQAADKGLRIVSDLPAGPLELTSDRGKIRQILINLLGNAVKFTAQGEIGLHVRADARMVYFEVRDTGEGIPKEQLQRIFEPFTQVNQSGTRVHGGTGLGLPVSLRLAQLLGGDLRVESVMGEGSQFTFSVPIEYIELVTEVPQEPISAE